LRWTHTLVHELVLRLLCFSVPSYMNGQKTLWLWLISCTHLNYLKT
jgi:hypothetical protein